MTFSRFCFFAHGFSALSWFPPRSVSRRATASRPLLASSLVLAVGVAGAVALLTTPAQAQVTFNGAQRQIGCGLANPHGLAVDRAGNLFVGDSENQALKEFPAVFGIIPANEYPYEPCNSQPSAQVRTLIQGSYHPESVAVDPSGNVYFVNGRASGLNVVLANFGTIPSSPTVVSIDNPNYPFFYPMAVAVGGVGDIYFAGIGNGF